MNTSSISKEQINEFAKSVSLGLSSLRKPEPLTATEWADQNFYLSSESSYHEGRWKTLPFQAAILNSMGNDEIREVNVVKSARLGYTKMLLAAMGYLLEHKKRNVMTFSPSDSDAENFMKTHVRTMVRDVPVVLELAPWHGRKHPDSTLSAMRFSNAKQFFIHGGKAARNYREKSVDAVIYDELAAFDADIEREGSPTRLGDKRLEGSTFPKSIRGSTPKTLISGSDSSAKGSCQITSAAEQSPVRLKFNVPCPHCEEEQVLQWGGPDIAFGVKWDEGKPETAYYLCQHNGCVIKQHELIQDEGRWICEETGLNTRDGIDWRDEKGQPARTPKKVGFYVWTIYSPFTTWEQIVDDFLEAKKDKNELKTFTNTTLGEVWQEEEEKTDWQQIYMRREVYAKRHQVPQNGLVLFGFIDTQNDRYEGRVWAFGEGEEAWMVDKWVLTGMPDSQELLQQVSTKIHRQYTRSDGQVMPVAKWGWDSGGHYTDEVYQQCKKYGIQWVIPTKGASTYGKPIANWPKRKNAKGIYLLEIGTDNAKEMIYSRLQIQPNARDSVPGCLHLPADDLICDEDEVKQLTAEVKKLKIVNGRRVSRWEAGGRRNEALDCLVGCFAMLRISQQRYGLDLQALADQQEGKTQDNAAPTQSKKRRIIPARI